MELYFTQNRYITHYRNRVKTGSSPAFVVSLLWVVFFICNAYLKFLFGKTSDGGLRNAGAVEYFLLCFICVIIFYQFYVLFLKNVNARYNGLFLLCIYLLSSVLLHIIVGSGLTKNLVLLAFILSLFVCRRFRLSRKELSILYWFIVFAVFLQILNGSSIWRRAEPYRFNSNICAISLMIVFCISIVRYACTKRKMSVIIALICFGLEFVFTSRGATTGCILFLLLFVVCRAWKKSCKSVTAFIILTVLTLFGIFVAYFYSEILFNILGKGKIVIFGKDIFTGRQEIWALTFQSIGDNFWLGVGGYLNHDYAVETSKSIFTNAHNQALAIFADFGIFQFVLFYSLLILLISTTCIVKRNRKNRRVLLTPIIFFVTITLMNYFESLYYLRDAVSLIVVAYILICNYSIATYRGRYIGTDIKYSREWIKNAG